MLKQYSYYYFIKFCDWFDEKSGAAKRVTSVNE